MATLADTKSTTRSGLRFLSAVLAVTAAGLLVGLVLGYGLVHVYNALSVQEALIYNR